MKKVFISHSGQLSSDLAREFHNFLRRVLSPIDAFFSDESIQIGDRWQNELHENLSQARYGIFFLTRANSKTAGWMLYEAGAIAGVNHSKKRVVPILVDLLPNEIHPLYLYFEWMTFNRRSFQKLISQINSECSASASLENDIIERRFEQEWPELERCWQTVVAAELDEKRRLEQEASKRQSFSEQQALSRVIFDADTFYNWTYAFHNVVHESRGICVKMMSGHGRNDELPASEQPGSVPPPHPGMKPFEIPIRNILDAIRELFEKLPETADCGIRVCLRDLRSDGRFYTFSRSVPNLLRNPNLDNNSVPIPKDCLAFKTLEETWSQAKCVIETTPDQGWGQDASHKNDAFYKTKSVLVGSVIAKDVKDGKIFNAYTMWALFVSSNREGVFKPYHHAILQACIDAFSSMANIMLRKDNCSNAVR